MVDNMMDGYPYCVELSAEAQAALEMSEIFGSVGYVFSTTARFVALLTLAYLIYKKSRFAKEKDSSSPWWLFLFLLIGVGGSILSLLPSLLPWAYITAGYVFAAGAYVVALIYGAYHMWKFKSETLKKILFLSTLFFFGGSLFANLLESFSRGMVYKLPPEYVVMLNYVVYQPGACALWKEGPDELKQVILP